MNLGESIDQTNLEEKFGMIFHGQKAWLIMPNVDTTQQKN
jgi:hypothetical protein